MNLPLPPSRSQSPPQSKISIVSPSSSPQLSKSLPEPPKKPLGDNKEDLEEFNELKDIKINLFNNDNQKLNEKTLLELYIDSFLSNCVPIFNGEGFLTGFDVIMIIGGQSEKFTFSVDQFITLGFELIDRYDLLEDADYKKRCKLLSKKIKFIYKYYIQSERTRGKGRRDMININAEMRFKIDTLNKETKQKIDAIKQDVLVKISNIKNEITRICTYDNDVKINSINYSVVGGRRTKKTKQNKRKNRKTKQNK